MKKCLFILTLSLSWLTACGQTGPLQLPLKTKAQEKIEVEPSEDNMSELQKDKSTFSSHKKRDS